MTTPGDSYYDVRDHKGRFVSTTGLSAAARKLAETGARARDLRPAWPAVGDYMARTAAQQFATEGARLGTPWSPLKPPYLRWKIRHGFSPAILIRTGAMRDSYTSRPMSVEEYGRSSAEFGSDDPKAHFHQFGTRNMPARPILTKTPEMEGTVGDVLAHYIATGRVKHV